MTAKKKATKRKSGAKTPASARTTRADQVLDLIRAGKSPAEICAATKWQSHTLRGFVSATLRKKLGMKVELVDGVYVAK